MDPLTLNKYLYVEQTSTWRIRSIYFFGILFWLFLVWGLSGAIVADPLYRFFVAPLLALLTAYYLISYGINLFYKKLDLKKHLAFIQNYWQGGQTEPSVDIFLPICGERLGVLENTWKNVAQIDYGKKKVYVLDDSKTECAEHRKRAEHYGFIYLERPNKGEMKKAGNLKHGYENSSGEFIVIFDADFAPHTDYLRELVPYMQDEKIAIIQTPQYFPTDRETHQRSPLAYGGSYVQEDFYRIIQVARDRLGGALCCGSNALYRRKALDEVGGTAQVEHSEDAITGFLLAAKGWRVKYLPIILAIGASPANLHAYFHQQHRWCSGSMSLMLNKDFWLSPLSIRQKLCYITGFLYYVSHPVGLLLSFQLFISLFFYNEHINFLNALPFYPYLFFSMVLLPRSRVTQLRFGSFYVHVIQLFSCTHAIFTALTRSSVGWIPTNAKQSGVSVAFRQATTLAGLYIFLYVLFTLVAGMLGLLHLFEFRYYSVQFWIFFNLFFSSIVFIAMRKTIVWTK